MTVNYTGRDYTSRYERLLEQFRTLVPELTDLNHSNAGIAMIRLLASESDFLSFYIDWVFNSLSVDTATFKQSIINIGKALDTLPKLASSATTEVVVTRGEDYVGAISIPKYTKFQRLDGVGYLTDYDVIIPADENSATIPVTQGDLVELTLNISDFDVVDYSKRLKYNLGANVAAYSSSVTDSSLELEWEGAESFYRTVESDRHYCLELHAQPIDDITDTVYLSLSKLSTSSDLPSSLDVRFIRTNGLDGNTGIGTINIVPAILQDVVTVSNSNPATGGGPCESIESLRWRVPAVARTQRRAVIKEDYETLITSISGVKFCEVYDRNDGDSFPHLYLRIYVLPEGNGNISNNLLGLILDECFAWGHLGNWEGRYLVRDFEKSPVDINARVGISDGHQAEAVFSSIRTALSTLYNADTTAYLKTWLFADLHNCVSGVSGVSWVEFSTSANAIAADGEILQLGTITLTQGM